MKASDTVIPTPDHSESIWCPHCGEEFGIEREISTAREEQAEVSFKAGLAEVTGWLRDHQRQDLAKGYYRIVFTEDEWSEKLKEWGISP